MHLLKQEHSTKVQIQLSANTSTSDMRCRKNVVLNTRCGCISASPAFDPGGKINHLFEKTTTKKKKEKKRQQLLLLSSLTRTRLTRGEGRRVVALSRCMTCRSGIKILKPASQVSMWINGIFLKILIRSKTTSLWIKVIKKANYRCQDSWKRAKPDKSQRQMTVNKSAGSKR